MSPPTPGAKPEPDGQAEKFAALAEQLREGVKVVSAPNLFPTPPEIARRLVELADIQPGQRILEPSAGTGNLIDAVSSAADIQIDAFEINVELANMLARKYASIRVDCGDFLMSDAQPLYDRVVMNPPFSGGIDIEHIRHAFAFLKPGGRLVAICANGPRQQEELGEISSRWIDLPPGSFQGQGTAVNTAIVVLES